MATVRIDSGLNDELKAEATRRGVSATKLVEQAVRALLTGQLPATTSSGELRERAKGARASLSRPARARAAGVALDCPHPPGRRIGGTCMACGASVR